MPPAIDLLPFQDDLEELYLAGAYTHQQLRDWLARQHGVDVAERTLKLRFKEWGLTRRETALTPVALESISTLFHTTTDNDDDIARALVAQGIAVSGRQVKRTRLSQGWRRRNNLPTQQEEQRQSTADAVTSALTDAGRSYGRNYMATALRLKGHKARFDDITDELRRQGPDSTTHRKPGKGNLESNGFFVSGQISDTVVLLFVFMPIIRYKVNQFVQMWNEHPIRKQRQLANHVPGHDSDMSSEFSRPRPAVWLAIKG
jgi:hypothetical protein